MEPTGGRESERDYPAAQAQLRETQLRLERQQQALEREIKQLRRDLASLKEAHSLTRRRLTDLQNHPAFRRLARLNVVGLKLLGLLGLGSAPPAQASPPASPVASLPVAVDGLAGKQPPREPDLQEAPEAYVDGFARLAFGPQSPQRGTSGKRVVVDVTRCFSEHLTGVGHYCDQLTRALLRQAPHQLTLYSAKPLPAWLLEYPGHPSFVHCPKQLHVTDFARLSDAPDLAAIAGPHDAYLDLSASYYPLVRSARRVSCVYDIAPISCPETVPPQVSQLCEQHAKYQAESAEVIVAISEFTKQEFIELTGVAPDRVKVIPVGLDAVFTSPPTLADEDRVRAKYGLQAPYILCVGTLQPRKNLLRLLRAYNSLRQQRRDLPRLVLAGSDKWPEVPDLAETLEQLRASNALSWIGYVDRMDMPALYRMSELFVYPSYFEGYGMPVAEALAAGAAVVCGDRTSVPEVAGDAALYCDPYSEEAIAAAILDGLDQAPALRVKSAARAAQFPTWDAVAAQYLALLKPLLR